MWNNNFNQPYSFNSYNGYPNNYMNNSRNYSSQNSYAQQQQQSYQNNIIWVKGKENARSMQLPPNSTVILLDSEVGKFYIKTTDDIGLGKLRVFNYIEQPDIEERASQTEMTTFSEIDLSNYVTKQQMEQMLKEIRDNEQLVSRAKSKKQSSSKSNNAKQ